MPRVGVKSVPSRQDGPPLQVLRAAIVLVAVCAAGIAVALSPRVAQDRTYHAFADARALLGIPNACDVVSNLAFACAGFLGLGVLASRRAVLVERLERRPWLVLFAAVVATSAGSAQYHLAPTNETLVWDRLPMSVAFSALVAALVSDRVSAKLGARLLAPLVVAGIASVAYWSATEARGVGDLRPYNFVQFGAMAAIPFLLALYPGRYTRSAHWVAALALYAASKVLEAADARVLAVTGFVSGHTLKHVAAAGAVTSLAVMLGSRQALPQRRRVAAARRGELARAAGMVIILSGLSHPSLVRADAEPLKPTDLSSGAASDVVATKQPQMPRDPDLPPAFSPPSRTAGKDARNAVFLELYGAGVLYSVNYERLVAPGEAPFTRLALRVGFSALPGYVSVPVTVSLLHWFGSAYALELGGGFFYSGIFDIGLAGTAILGFRLGSPTGGPMVRLAYTPLFGGGISRSGDPLHWGGFAIGGMF